MTSVVALFGPTASGKSAVAVALAERIGGEVVSADAMQCYRGLPILTNQPPAADLARVPHHCVAVWDPSEEGDVMRYAAMARAAIDDVLARGRVPIVAGGTGLYLRAAVADLEPPPEPPAGLRERIAAGASDAALHARLHALDPGAAARLHPHDRRRVVRALELVALGHTLVPAGDDELWSDATRHPTLFVGLDVPRAELHRRIAERTRAMLDGGVVEEVRALLARPEPVSSTFARAHGLSDVIELLEGAPRAACEQRLVERTRQYAKRQQTWLRRLSRVHLVDGTLAVNEAAAQIDVLLAAERERSPLPSAP